MKKHFVAVAVDGRKAMSRANVDGRFVREDCELRLAGAGGNLVCVSAAGQILDKNWSPRRGYEAWLKLPVQNRRPGAVKVPDSDAQPPAYKGGGPTQNEPKPPPGCLIVKVYQRTLARDQKGQARRATPDDISSDHHMVKKLTYYEANPDFLWLTETEWKSLVPSKAEQGDSFPVEAAVAERIFRFHLNPTMTFGESNGLRKQGIRAGKLTLTVESVTASHIRLRLEGFVHLGSTFEAADRAVKNSRTAFGYEPRLLGYLNYDRKKNSFIRFDVVAFGDTYGRLGGDLKYLYRPGRYPMGVAFELVSGNAPANRVPPRGMRFPKNYWNTGR